MKLSIKALLYFCLVIYITTDFSLAEDPLWDANEAVLTGQKLSNGVFAFFSKDSKHKAPNGIPMVTSGGFVVGRKGVLLIDTMINKRLFDQVSALIRKETDKPVIYALNTSYMGDHQYGNAFLPPETRIIQHLNTKTYVDNYFLNDIEFMLKRFGEGRGIEEITPRKGDILVGEKCRVFVDLGGMVVEIIDFGYAHTGGDLFIWHPQAEVLWTGKAITAVKPAIPWIQNGHLPETIETLSRVYNFISDETRIVPGNGPVMKREDLKWHIEYLVDLKEAIEDAIDQDLSLEETVDFVKMIDFRGYREFDKVHSGFNVPAAYKDLMDR